MLQVSMRPNVITKAKKKDCLLCTRKQSMRDLGSNVKNAITVVLTEAHILVTRKLHIVEQKFLNLSISLQWFVIAQCSVIIQFHNILKGTGTKFSLHFFA